MSNNLSDVVTCNVQSRKPQHYDYTDIWFFFV